MAGPEKIRITCDGCNVALKVSPRLAGKQIACPQCGAPVEVPHGSTPDGAAIPDVLELAPRRAPAPEPPLPRFTAPPPARLERRRPELEPIAPSHPLSRYAHWLLLVALLPLALSFLGDDSVRERFERSLAQVDPAVLERMPAEAGLDELMAVLPGHKLVGAHLPRGSSAHWAYAGVAGLAFAGLAAAFPRGRATFGSLVGVAVFTGTVGIVLLLGVQLAADATYGVIVTGRGVLTLLFYIVKFIGFSYRAALDPENGFVPSLLGFTFGVGLCEELCKAAPIIFHYRSKGTLDWRGACLWGLASGIGFGIAEGIHYAGDSYNGVSTAWIYVVRFLSCVALHATWSAGVAITIARDPTGIQGEDEWYLTLLSFVPPLLVAMVLHALYDTALKRDLNVVALLVAVGSVGWLAWLIHRQTSEEG